MSLGGLLRGIFTGGDLMKDIRDIADEFCTTDEERQDFELKMESLLHQRMSAVEKTLRTEVESRASIIIAEMQQGDSFTKRARPSLIYFGLFIIFWNYCLIPSILLLAGNTPAGELQPFSLPFEFWAAWGGVVGIWSGGRTMEKVGMKNRAISLITGNNNLPSRSAEFEARG